MGVHYIDRRRFADCSVLISVEWDFVTASGVLPSARDLRIVVVFGNASFVEKQKQTINVVRIRSPPRVVHTETRSTEYTAG